MFVALACAVVTSQVTRTPDGYDLIRDSRYFGVGVAAGGDADGDGTPDVLVAEVQPQYVADVLVADGGVWLLSGRDGHVIQHARPKDAHERFGWCIAGLGDIDCDGCSDWIAGSKDLRTDRPGFAEIRSGRTGDVLYRFEGSKGFGCWVGAAGDFDGDGRPDAIVAGDPDVPRTSGTTLATVFSGADGSEDCRILAFADAERLVANPVCVGDIDGDGCAELALLVSVGSDMLQLRIHRGRDGALLRIVAISTPERAPYLDFDLERWTLSTTKLPWTGQVADVLVSCATGECCLISPSGRTIWKHGSEYEFAGEIELGAGAATPGDIDGDGISDLLIGRDSAGIGEGWVVAYAGSDGHVLRMWGTGEADGVNLFCFHAGSVIASVGDVDGDGVADAIIGTDHTLYHGPGCAFLMSPRTGRRIFGVQRNAKGMEVLR